MRLDFTKMQSLGNDFVVLDGVTSPVTLDGNIARQLADRHFGIGCDQILLAQPGTEADFRFRIFNQDGSEVEQCGNGARCFARFIRERKLSSEDRITVETLNARMSLIHLDGGNVRVEMGIPTFVPALIPFVADAEADRYMLQLGPEQIEIGAVGIGNPHAVTIVNDVDRADVATLGAEVERHARFPARVNAGFMQVVSREHIRLRVFERGVGETLGCGSGACASVVCGIRQGLLDSQVRVSLPGGDAWVSWAGAGSPVALSGPATTVYTGSIEIQ